jgi:hypothetical protein
VLPRHDPRLEPRIIARWKKLFFTAVRSAADFDLVGGPFQAETARRMGIDVVKDLDLDANCDEASVSKMRKDTESETSPLRSMSRKAVSVLRQAGSRMRYGGAIRHSSVLGMMAGVILGDLVWILCFEMVKKVKCKEGSRRKLCLVFGAWRCGLPWGGVESLCLNVAKTRESNRVHLTRDFHT